MKNYYGKLLKLLFFKFRLEMEKLLLRYKCVAEWERNSGAKLHGSSTDVLKNYNECIDKYVKFSIFHITQQAFKMFCGD